MRIRKLKFNDAEIPEWTLEGKEPSIYTFIETIALAGLEDKYIRLSAGLQRKLLGFPVFGKQSFIVKKDGTFIATAKTCFGSDFNDVRGPLSYVGVAAKRSERISANYSGKGIFSVYAYEHEFTA